MKRGTPEHPKLHQLADLLGIPWLHAVGLLEVLWHTTAKYAPMGNIGKWDNRAIAEHLREKKWIKHPDILIGALVECGWLDRDPEHRLLVHDWDQHADQSVRKTLKYNSQDFIKPSRDQRVYFVRAIHSRKIKIGVTGRCDGSRFMELRKNSLEPLEMLLEIPGGFALEDELHRKFSSSRDRVHSEWFEESEELLNVIRDLSGVVPDNFQHSGDTYTPHRAGVALPLPLPEPLETETKTVSVSGGFLEPSDNGPKLKRKASPETIEKREKLKAQQKSWFEEFRSLFVWKWEGEDSAWKMFSWKVKTEETWRLIRAAVISQTKDQLSREDPQFRTCPTKWLIDGKWKDKQAPTLPLYPKELM